MGLSAVAAMGQPAITAVLDGAALTNNIAQGSVFVVKGAGLSPAGFAEATAPAYPTVLNEVKITLTPVAGGPVITPRIVNTYNLNLVNQVVAVLPSNTALGSYDVRVQNGASISPPFHTGVVARKPGIVTANATGAGPAQATLDGKLILQRTANLGKIGTYDTRSAHLGERVDLWGTGLGADAASDAGGSSGDQTAAGQVRVLVNGAEVTPAFAGRAPVYPGLDVIVFNLPSNAPLSCTVDIQVRAGGVLSNLVTISTSAGDACPSAPAARINEIESSGGTPGDWVEIYNPGPGSADLTGYLFKDNDDAHSYQLPVTVIAPGGYALIEEAAAGFGLDSTDSVRLFRPDGTLADSFSWTSPAATTYARCPGGMTTSTASTKGATNDCSIPVRINELQSSSGALGGTPGGWVELYNPSAAPVDLSGFVFRDIDDTHAYMIPFGTALPASGFLVLEDATFGFALDGTDSARLYDANGALLDSYTWTVPASTTYGRCPDGSGVFVTTAAVTKGAANACPAGPIFSAWPGGATVQTVDNADAFKGGLSGLAYELPGGNVPVLWGVRSGPGTLFRLIFNGTAWVPDLANGWSGGKALRYPDGFGDPDAEGLTFGATDAGSGMYVSSERNNSANTISRNSILRYDAAGGGGVLTATHEWDLTADLPATGPDAGIEGITWVPDDYLVSQGFYDDTKFRAYYPANYPNHGTGLFFVGLESNGLVYAYALDHSNNTFTRIATIATGLPSVMDLQFDRDLNDLWAVCDDTCRGRSVVLRIGAGGRFSVARRFERPAGMPNLNNEGFTIAPAIKCIDGVKPVFWSDDGETDGHAIRRGTLTCTAF